jgi:pimeloyl-ACP methyl ester carboxylesterase
LIETFDLPLPQGITLSCRAAGDRAAPRLVFLHGFPEAAFVWDELMERFADRYRCVAPNLRGYERSSRPAEVEAYRAKHLAADLEALIEAIGAPVDALVAHDWGGAAAWALAVHRPDLMKRLVIVNSPHPGAFLRELKHNPVQQLASTYMNFLVRRDAAALLSENDYRRLFKFFDAPRPASWLTDEVKRRYREVWDAGLEGALNYYRASPLRPATGPDDPLHQLEFEPERVTVKVPTLVIWGERDTALPPSVLDGLQAWVPRLRMVGVADASHWIVHEQPDLIAAELERELRSGRGS